MLVLWKMCIVGRRVEGAGAVGRLSAARWRLKNATHQVTILPVNLTRRTHRLYTSGLLEEEQEEEEERVSGLGPYKFFIYCRLNVVLQQNALSVSQHMDHGSIITGKAFRGACLWGEIWPVGGNDFGSHHP